MICFRALKHLKHPGCNFCSTAGLIDGIKGQVFLRCHLLHQLSVCLESCDDASMQTLDDLMVGLLHIPSHPCLGFTSTGMSVQGTRAHLRPQMLTSLGKLCPGRLAMVAWKLSCGSCKGMVLTSRFCNLVRVVRALIHRTHSDQETGLQQHEA